MKRLAMSALILGMAQVAYAGDKTACGLLTRAEAEQLVGGTLGEPVESKRAEPGSDPRTECSFFPKGYRLDTAEGPPEPGVNLTVHAMKNADSAKRFYEATFSMSNEAKADVGSPFAKDKISKLKGIWDAAFLVDRAQTAFVFILKGSRLTQVQIWKQTGSSAQIATTAAKQVAAKL